MSFALPLILDLHFILIVMKRKMVDSSHPPGVVAWKGSAVR